MKLDREFSFEELPKRVRESITELSQKHSEQLVRDYNETLMENGLILGYTECNHLSEKIAQATKVTVKISAKCDSDILSLYHVYPQDMYQNRLDDFDTTTDEKETTLTITSNGEPIISTTVDKMQQVADMLEKRKTAAEAIEEASE